MRDLEDKEDLLCFLRIHKFILCTVSIKCITVHFRHVWSFKWSKYYLLCKLHLIRMALHETGMVNSCFTEETVLGLSFCTMSDKAWLSFCAFKIIRQITNLRMQEYDQQTEVADS